MLRTVHKLRVTLPQSRDSTGASSRTWYRKVTAIVTRSPNIVGAMNRRIPLGVHVVVTGQQQQPEESWDPPNRRPFAIAVSARHAHAARPGTSTIKFTGHLDRLSG